MRLVFFAKKFLFFYRGLVRSLLARTKCDYRTYSSWHDTLYCSSNKDNNKVGSPLCVNAVIVEICSLIPSLAYLFNNRLRSILVASVVNE